MKELSIAFIIALVIGSVYNGMRGDSNVQSDATQANPGGQYAQQSGPNNDQAIAGQELVVDIDEGSFQGYVLDAREPVLVEFYTDNCPHCVRMAPTLGQLAYNGQGVLRLCKINASKAASLAERYDISGVPAFALFMDGHVVDTTAGARSFEELRSWLTTHNVSVPETLSKT